MELAEGIAAATKSFVEALSDYQRPLALLPFDEDERRAWAYWPTDRKGLPLSALDRRQTKSAFRLLASLLPLNVYARAVTIMTLDEVLDRLEDYRTDRRHRDDYWVTVFGTPIDDSWGVRFEGHHVSVHGTICRGEVRLTPLFLGANPATLRDGNHVVIAPLGPEEQLGFELLHSLSRADRDSAVASQHPPPDIVTRNQAVLDCPLALEGVPLATLTGAAAAAAQELLEVYLKRLPEGSLLPDVSGARFLWAGSEEPGTGHYYRISAPRLLIEFDNTQNSANHIHTVLRDPIADFGGDMLLKHYQKAHRLRKAPPA